MMSIASTSRREGAWSGAAACGPSARLHSAGRRAGRVRLEAGPSPRPTNGGAATTSTGASARTTARQLRPLASPPVELLQLLCFSTKYVAATAAPASPHEVFTVQ